MKRIWSIDELAEHWSLKYEETQLLKTKPSRNHLAFVAQLKYYQNTGRFPLASTDLPETPLHYLAEQLETTVALLHEYDWRGRTGTRHRQEILEFLGIRRVSATDKATFLDWLIENQYPHGASIEDATESAFEWFQNNQVEYPTDKELERLVRSAYQQFESNLYAHFANCLSPESKIQMEQSLDAVKDVVNFGDIKADPGRLGLDSVLKEVEKLSFIRSLHLPIKNLAACNTKVLQRYRQRVNSETAWEVKQHPENIRYGLYTIFLYWRQREIIDGLIELFIQIVHRLSARAERKLVKTLLCDFQKVHGKTALLFRIAEAALNNPNGQVKEVLYPVAGEDTLKSLLKEYKSSGLAYQKQVHKILRSSYSNHYRRMLPKILDALTFCSNNTQHRPVLDALDWLKCNQANSQRYIKLDDSIPVDGVIQPKWREVVIEDNQGEKRINRINYEICVLQTLRKRLRCKEIWVIDADRYRNPDDDLPLDFDINRASYYHDLGQTVNATAFVEKLRGEMSSALELLNREIPKNRKVRILSQGKNRISITPLTPQQEPMNLAYLKREITSRWPMTSLLDVLKEADLRIGFSDHFKTVAERENLDRQSLQQRILLCLYGMGTNTGLKRVSGSRHGISYKELLNVRRHFIHKAALRNAIGQVANAIFTARNPSIWGDGTTSCASDSKKFGSWDQNLMTEWHIRYGGRGVMIYWHVEKKSTCIYSQLKRCSSSEVASMIEGVLRHCTDMEIDRQYVDSHGQSEVAFAFSHLLGFDLLPRLKAIASQKLYRPGDDKSTDYPNLESVLTRPINWELIIQQYDEMIKYTTALKQGTADPEAILRRFTRNNIQHPTYKALAELGKVIKTIFLCRYIGSEELRQEIHEGLNVVENWNSANSFIFYGKGGEVATNRLEDQELSVLALHLLQISLVYVNTLMIQQVLNEPGWLSRMKVEDFRALTPLIYAHVNPYGIFELDMDTRLPIEMTA
ncbi:Tn3 family transposase [Aeromonas salmonicida]|uniref:Tn3 family transposase n=1 Tax=Aeromonas salmonicida TaxID=645 RepID=UPI001788D839|nr:Tn3 family transposase [Aeromonas salmonicida]QOI95902.1 Tn3 family transposase [Aeromonas salmonicida subsp. masoucida]